MVIYLKSEKHGTKVAISEAEALEDEKNGWVRYVPGEVLNKTLTLAKKPANGNG